MQRNTEIERKFLVCGEEFMSLATEKHEIAQGYLCREAERTIRVRICDARAFITIKSNTIRDGIAKFEWEKEIDLGDANELLEIALPGVIKKTRYIIPAPAYKGQKRKWEVDVFHGRLEGQLLAEIELGAEDEPYERPAWIGDEVTGDERYTNAYLSSL